MNIQYNPTPLDILKLLGCADSDGRALLEEFEAAHKVKLPPLLFDFFSAVWNHPMFSTADIWVTDDHPELYFSYEELEETISEWKEDWAENPDEYGDNVCYQLSRLPRDRWQERVSNHLVIGSDYSAGVVTFGIRVEDLTQPDPPVYVLHEADAETDWKVLDNSLSLFLMRILADVLSCGEYDVAQEVLEEEEEWNYTVIEDLGEARRQAEQLGIDLSKTARCGSLYAAAVTPDVCRYCCIEEKKLFFLLKEDTGNDETTCVILSHN